MTRHSFKQRRNHGPKKRTPRPAAPVYELLPAQREFLYVTNPHVQLDVCVYQGGFGSGKTFIGALLGHYLSYCIPRNRGIVVAKTYPLVRDTTLQMYFEHFEKLGLKESVDYIWKMTEHKIQYRNGSEILFRHLDNPNKVKSLNLGWAHMEEMGDMDEAGFLMLLSRLRLSGIKRYRLFGTTNPQPTSGWLKQYFEHDRLFSVPHSESENDSRQSINNELLIQYRRIIAPSTENKHLNDSYLENMRQQYSADYYRMNVLGQDFNNTKGLVCPHFSEANLDKSITYQKDLRLYLTCDFNVDPMCWLVAHRTLLPDGQAQYEFIDELCIENTNIIESAQEFLRRYGKHEAGITITGDATGRNRSDSSANPNESKYRILLNALSDGGTTKISLDVPTANPHQDIRVETWNGLLCNAEDVRRIRIHPERCHWLVWNLKNLRYLPGTNVISEPSLRQIEKDTTHSLKFTKHPFDAASYLVYRYDPIKVTEDPRGDIVNFSGDYAEIATIDNSIGVLKAEGQLVAGAQNPFQGSASIDYQKTATELQILQENSISVLREIIEHISIMGIQRVLERLMYLVADLYAEPVEVPVSHPFRGREFQLVDFSVLKSGEFTIEVVSTNPSQSKQAQINGLMQLLELIHTSPDALVIGEPVIEKIGDLVGIKNIRDLLDQIKQRYQTNPQST